MKILITAILLASTVTSVRAENSAKALVGKAIDEVEAVQRVTLAGLKGTLVLPIPLPEAFSKDPDTSPDTIRDQVVKRLEKAGLGRPPVVENNPYLGFFNITVFDFRGKYFVTMKLSQMAYLARDPHPQVLADTWMRSDLADTPGGAADKIMLFTEEFINDWRDVNQKVKR